MSCPPDRQGLRRMDASGWLGGWQRRRHGKGTSNDGVEKIETYGVTHAPPEQNRPDCGSHHGSAATGPITSRILNVQRHGQFCFTRAIARYLGCGASERIGVYQSAGSLRAFILGGKRSQRACADGAGHGYTNIRRGARFAYSWRQRIRLSAMAAPPTWLPPSRARTGANYDGPASDMAVSLPPCGWWRSARRYNNKAEGFASSDANGARSLRRAVPQRCRDRPSVRNSSTSGGTASTIKLVVRPLPRQPDSPPAPGAFTRHVATPLR